MNIGSKGHPDAGKLKDHRTGLFCREPCPGVVDTSFIQKPDSLWKTI